jgi:hypothetical protein
VDPPVALSSKYSSVFITEHPQAVFCPFGNVTVEHTLKTDVFRIIFVD